MHVQGGEGCRGERGAVIWRERKRSVTVARNCASPVTLSGMEMTKRSPAVYRSPVERRPSLYSPLLHTMSSFTCVQRAFVTAERPRPFNAAAQVTDRRSASSDSQRCGESAADQGRAATRCYAPFKQLVMASQSFSQVGCSKPHPVREGRSGSSSRPLLVRACTATAPATLPPPPQAAGEAAPPSS